MVKYSGPSKTVQTYPAKNTVIDKNFNDSQKNQYKMSKKGSCQNRKCINYLPCRM